MAAALTARAGEMAFASSHPTSVSTAFPEIHALKAFDGRIYAGHGNWNYYPAVCIGSYDPKSGTWRTEHSPGSDSVGVFRQIRGSLYVPSIDPVHFDEFSDFSVLTDGVWRRHTPAAFFHVFDFAMVAENDLWMVGAKGRSETFSRDACVWRSVDGGLNWAEVTLTNSQARYYYCFPLHGRLYVRDTVYDGTNATRIPQAPYETLSKPMNVPTSAGELVIGLAQPAPGNGGFSRSAFVSFDGTNWARVKTNVIDFTLQGTTLYTLDYNPTSSLNEIQAADISASPFAWLSVPLSNVPSSAKALEVMDGVAYVGTTDGELWLGKLDGSPTIVPAQDTFNELPDGFGRAISADDATLVIGAPESSSTLIMSGEVTVWTRASRGQPWSQPQVITPPTPSYAASFGKDVAVAHGLIAVLESGADTTGRDRGMAAQVHIYEQIGGAWQWRQTITNTYAQSISLTSNKLWVAASTNLREYTVSRGPAGASLTLVDAHSSNNSPSLYEPYARVAANDTRLAFANIGDFSRSGGPGQVTVYEANGSKWREIAVLQRNNQPLPNWLIFQPDAFGSAVALWGDWLAVGSPRDDQAAAQAGAVHLYQRVVIGSSISYVPRQTIISPVPQPGAGFGSSLAFHDNYLVIGMPGWDSTSNRREGQAYLYRLIGTNAVPVAAMSATSGSLTEFGAKVALDGDIVITGSRASVTNADSLARIAAQPIIDVVGPAANLAAYGSVAPMQATAGTPVTLSVVVSNAGPSTATEVLVQLQTPTNGAVASITASAGTCTNDNGVISCSVAELELGGTVIVTVTIEPTFAGYCQVMRSRVSAAAAEFDLNLRDNEFELLVNHFPPSAAILSPVAGDTVRFGTPVLFTAEAAATNGVAQVRYLTNGVTLGNSFSSPYSYTWPQARPGIYSVTALVFDQCGVMRTSAPVTLVVTSNSLPSISFTAPLNRTRYAATNDIRVAVTAHDPDGAVTMVRVYSGLTLLRTLSSAPYAFTWTNAPLGAITLRAVAFDNDGGTNASDGVQIVTGNQADTGTNWVAFNDHESGSSTHINATRYNIHGGFEPRSGPLRNITNNASAFPASLAITTFSLQTYSSPAGAPAAGSPAAQVFDGYIDYSTGTFANVPVAVGQSVTCTFTGLSVGKLYSLKMTAIRGSASYTDRWSLMTLNGAQSFRAAHTSGALSPGASGLAPNQVAINTGYNTAGDLAEWQDIVPGPNGTIAVVTTQYTGLVPGGSGATGSYGYAPTMLRLEQMSLLLPAVTTSADSQTVSPGTTPTFSVVAAGEGPLTYQWVRDGLEITGATESSLTLPPVQHADVGHYNVRVSSPQGHAFGVPAVLSVFTIDTALELHLSGPVGQRYSIQRRAAIDLPTGASWETFTNITVTAVPVKIADDGATNRIEGYYRAIAVP